MLVSSFLEAAAIPGGTALVLLRAPPSMAPLRKPRLLNTSTCRRAWGQHRYQEFLRLPHGATSSNFIKPHCTSNVASTAPRSYLERGMDAGVTTAGTLRNIDDADQDMVAVALREWQGMTSGVIIKVKDDPPPLAISLGGTDMGSIEYRAQLPPLIPLIPAPPPYPHA